MLRSISKDVIFCEIRSLSFHLSIILMSSVFHPQSSAKNKDLRIDWHQTPSTVTVAIYAKNYDPNVTCVYLTPVRMDLDVFFPADDFTYKKEIELGGVSCIVFRIFGNDAQK